MKSKRSGGGVKGWAGLKEKKGKAISKHMSEISRSGHQKRKALLEKAKSE